MIRINLLPHRQERRKAQRKHLAILAGMVAALGIAIVVMVHGVFAGYLSIQNDRNDFIKKENARLDKEIDEIKKLKVEIDPVKGEFMHELAAKVVATPPHLAARAKALVE